MEYVSDLFEQAISISRKAALPVLERDAIERGTIIVVCQECSKFITEKPSDGISGLSHGLCDECFAVIPGMEVQ